MSCASCQCHLPPSDALPTSIQTQELREFLRSRSILADPSRYESEIASSTTALMHYDSEIQRLEGSLRTLKADRQRLQVKYRQIPCTIAVTSSPGIHRWMQSCIRPHSPFGTRNLVRDFWVHRKSHPVYLHLFASRNSRTSR